MADGSFLNMPGFLQFSKSKEVQSRFLLRGEVLIRFCIKNDLIKEEFLESVYPLTEATVVRRSHLSALGLAFDREGAVGRWYDAHDRGRPIEDTSILECGLKKVKEYGPDHFLDDEWIKKFATPE